VATIWFKLTFARTSRTDAAAETRHLRPLADKARHGVFQLRQLDLKFSLRAHRVERENVEDEHTSVDDAHTISEPLFDVFDLRRRKLAVENDRVHLAAVAQRFQFLELAASNVRRGVGVLFLLYHFGVYLSARRVGKTSELAERRFVLALVRSFRHDRDQHAHRFFRFVKYLLHNITSVGGNVFFQMRGGRSHNVATTRDTSVQYSTALIRAAGSACSGMIWMPPLRGSPLHMERRRVPRREFMSVWVPARQIRAGSQTPHIFGL
jgi:hypothetical protein